MTQNDFHKLVHLVMDSKAKPPENLFAGGMDNWRARARLAHFLAMDEIDKKDEADELFHSVVEADYNEENSEEVEEYAFALQKLSALEKEQGKFDEADALMERLLSQDNRIPGGLRKTMVCDRIYVELIRENRPEVLEGLRTKDQVKFMKAMKKFPSVLRTEYAYALLAEKDPEKAQTVMEAFEKAARTYPNPNDITIERELMETAREAAAV